MASITPTSLSCSREPHSGKGAYLRLDITSISDSDATTNKRYIGTKVTFQGEAWTTLYAWQVTLGGQSVTEKIQENYSGINDWRTGDILASPSLTFNNNSDGTLTLRAYVKQMFYYGMGVPSRFDNSYYYQDASVNMVCSKLPRYTSFSTHTVDNTTLNTATIKWSAPDTVDKQEYQLDGGSWTTFTGSSYTLTGLTPGSTHKVKTRIRRKDSQLTTTSNELSFTLKSLPTSNTPSNINLGSKQTVSISSVSYLTKWICEIWDGSTKIKEDTNITATSKELDISASSIISGMLSRHKTDNEWNLTYKFKVVSNGTTYTLTERTAKITIPTGQYTPTYDISSVSYTVTDSTSNNITGSNQKVIKGISDVTYTIGAATPNGSANMSRYIVSTGDKSVSVNSAASMSASITDVEAGSFSVQAVDSRGRSTTVSKNYSTYIDYFKPIVTNYNIVRKDAILANLVFNITGTFCKWSGLQVSNTITAIKYQYKLKGASSYSAEIACTGLTFNNDTFTLSYIGTGELINTSNEYDIKINIYDKLTTTSFEVPIGTGRALLWRDLANTRIGIGKKPTTTLDVNGDIACSDLTGALITAATLASSAAIGSTGKTLASLVTQVNTNKTDISTNKTNISTNATNISTNASDISTIKSAFYTHRGNTTSLNQYNVGIYRYSKGSGGPGGTTYGTLIVIPYRKGTGNTATDYCAQLFIPTSDTSTPYKDNIFFRTSGSSGWRNWIPLINNYVTDKEIITNETLDGKPVYAKRITITTDITSSVPLSRAHNIANVDEIWVDTAHSYMRSNNQSSNLSYPTPAVEYYGNFSDATGISVDRTTIRVYVQSGWGGGWTKTFMLKYTKTTD